MFALLSRLIAIDSSVGCGDSITLEETGIFDFLRTENYTFLDKFNPTLSKEEKHKLYLENFSVNTFITGSNAITMNGKIFNINGNGSRVAPMLYGPKQVIIVVDFNYYE
ncbi:LUD domain-containing protein [Acetobacterium carbinolicum]|uniref:LUD domain-containing protein n=1 Tax=Acetobacterium carbinolicum TaxID=52690 RepID=UPI0039C90E0A